MLIGWDNAVMNLLDYYDLQGGGGLSLDAISDWSTAGERQGEVLSSTTLALAFSFHLPIFAWF